MIVNLDVVDDYTGQKKRKQPEKRKKQQPTQHQRIIKHQNVN